VLFGTAEAVPFPVLLGGQSPRRSRIFYAALNAQREIVAHRVKRVFSAAQSFQT